MSGYFDYYTRTIDQHNTGLKLVGGGTGLGKTSSIPDVVKSLPSDKKAIYVANRLQLLKEMANRFEANEVVVLPRDFEAVRNTLKLHRYAFDSLLASSLFEAHIEHIDVPKLRRTSKTLLEIFSGNDATFLPRWQEEAAEDHARALLKDFRTLLLSAKSKSKKDYNSLLDHPVIQSLFPFIAFQRRPEVRLLVVSLQKLFYGVFNGENTLTVSRLKNYIIFADEFDFLENELISLISRSTQINDPFRFVEFFYREMQRHKLHLETYPASASSDIRRRINEIMAEIEGLHSAGIKYPEINQFISTENTNDAVIFRTSHTVSSNPIYLCQTDRAFNIVFEKSACTSSTFSARRLLTTVSGVSERILTLLKELENDDPQTHRGLIADCYRTTTFPQQIGQVSQFPRPGNAEVSRLGSLLDSGYSMYDIHYLAKATDPEEVELRSYAVYTTPEKFMATLAEKNLVFALSATADIPRCVNHFNLNWLGAKERVQVLAPDTIDQEIVADLNYQKAEYRANKLSVVRLPELDSKQPVEKALSRFIATAANLDGFGSDTNEGHLKRRVERFFASLLWASKQPALDGEPQTHLMFLNTYKQVEFFFTTEALRDSDFYRINANYSSNVFNTYELDFNGQLFIVVFYNAEQAKRIHLSQKTKDEFDALFQLGKPVVVVTQFLSAGNGVNLQYHLPNGAERDFINLHLLEVPYYYFSVFGDEDTVEERIAKLKENLWYLAKLHSAKYLSENEFKAKLGTLHKPNDWNQVYQQHPRMHADYHLNTVASLIQALGRIERVWEPMPNQSVILCREAYHAFQRFLDDDFEGIREARSSMISNNLAQLLNDISAQIPQQERAIRRSRETHLPELDNQCKQMVKSILEQFEAVRQGEAAGQVRYIWSRLREAALKHDFADELLQEYSCVFSSRHIHDAKVWLTPEREIIPSHLAQPDTYLWRLNAVYDVINGNKAIREHFAYRGYELNFPLDQHTGFVPYFYQAILAGAVGEEAITALLMQNDYNFEDVPNALFEVADLKFAQHPWYVDCKNYSDSTLERFLLENTDLGYFHKLSGNYFNKRAIQKWQLLADYHGQDSRLIYINLATTQDRHLGYYQCLPDRLKPVHRFSDANVIVIQGALNTHTPNEYQEPFTRFLEDMEKYHA